MKLAAPLGGPWVDFWASMNTWTCTLRFALACIQGHGFPQTLRGTLNPKKVRSLDADCAVINL